MVSALNNNVYLNRGRGGIYRELMTAPAMPRLGQEWLHDVKSVDAPIPSDSRLVMYTDKYSAAADRFRMLRMHLASLERIKRLKVLMVTSAMPREGKTVTAINLALGMSNERPNSTVLVELDLRRPALSKHLNLEMQPGLTTCLQEGIDPISAVRRVNPLGIYVLPAGPPVSNPINLMNAENFARTIKQLRSSFEWVIVDSPPVLPVPDVFTLLNHADGWIWVIRAGKTRREVTRDAMDRLGLQRIAAVVLNHAADDERVYSSYYEPCSPLLLNSGR